MTIDLPPTMKDAPIFLCPHSFLSGDAEEQLCNSFKAVAICRPWHLEAFEPAENHKGAIRVVRPPETLKPPSDFRRLLSEYRLWMRQNLGRAPISSDRGDEATWHIRKALRQSGKNDSTPTDAQAFKWHLILHLAYELEESQSAADQMLLQMRTQSSPLEEALGEGPPLSGLWDDLAHSTSTHRIEERHLPNVLEAWFGLFGSCIPKGAGLLTLSPEVLNYASELFEIEPPRSFSADSNSCRVLELPLPPFDANPEKDVIWTGFAGRTLMLLTY